MEKEKKEKENYILVAKTKIQNKQRKDLICYYYLTTKMVLSLLFLFRTNKTSKDFYFVIFPNIKLSKLYLFL